MPKKHGGLGLRMCGIWNKAMLGKQLWSIANKEDSLWVRWIHGRYLKHDQLWDVPLSSTVSWHWRKLLRLRDQFQAVVLNGVWIFSSDGKYSPKSGYMYLMGVQRTIPWANVVWNRFNLPKHGFIMWLICHKKLLTRDRLLRWGMGITDSSCLLCAGAYESLDHLYFHCSFSTELCKGVTDWLQISGFPRRFSEWLHWVSHVARQKTVKAKLVVAAVNALVYHLWKARNACLHGVPRPAIQSLLFRFKREVTLKALGCAMGIQTHKVRQALRLA